MSIQQPVLKWLLHACSGVYAILAILFACASVARIAIGSVSIREGARSGLDRAAADAINEAIGVRTAAVVALQITQTIAEEGIVRDTDVSRPTRVRRCVSRFLVVVVALAIDSRIAKFRAAHGEPIALLQWAALVTSIGGLFASWGSSSA